MSKAIASAKPARRARSPAPTTPPAGPETSSRAGCAAASSAGRTPPEESITTGSGSPASAAAAAERAQVAGRDRREVRVGRGRRGALVLPELGRDLVRRDDVDAGMPPPQLRRDGLLVRRVAEREEEADGDRLRVAESGSESSSSGSSSPSGPSRPRTPWQRSSGTSGSGCSAQSR